MGKLAPVFCAHFSAASPRMAKSFHGKVQFMSVIVACLILAVTALPTSPEDIVPEQEEVSMLIERRPAMPPRPAAGRDERVSLRGDSGAPPARDPRGDSGAAPARDPRGDSGAAPARDPRSARRAERSARGDQRAARGEERSARATERAAPAPTADTTAADNAKSERDLARA